MIFLRLNDWFALETDLGAGDDREFVVLRADLSGRCPGVVEFCLLNVDQEPEVAAGVPIEAHAVRERTCGVVGAAAGSLFVFKGVYKAVLINYPTMAQRDELIRKALE